MVYYNHTAKIGGDLFLDWSRDGGEAPYMATRSQQVSSHRVAESL